MSGPNRRAVLAAAAASGKFSGRGAMLRAGGGFSRPCGQTWLVDQGGTAPGGL